jgi:hypothetical protein
MFLGSCSTPVFLQKTQNLALQFQGMGKFIQLDFIHQFTVNQAIR